MTAFGKAVIGITIAFRSLRAAAWLMIDRRPARQLSGAPRRTGSST
jgi:hypothetical protein